MSIQQEKIIDIIASGRKPDEAVLVIFDELDWSKKNRVVHLDLLEKKLNSYLSFIESNEIFEKYPEHKGKKIFITVIGKYPLCDDAVDYFKKASDVIKDAGFELRFELGK